MSRSKQLIFMITKPSATCFPYTASFNLIFKPTLWDADHTHFTDGKTKAKRAQDKTQNNKASIWTRAATFPSPVPVLKAHLRLLLTDACWACLRLLAVLQSRRPAKRLTAGAEKELYYFSGRPAVESSQHVNHTHQHSKDFHSGLMVWQDVRGSGKTVDHPRRSLQRRPTGRPRLVTDSGPCWHSLSKCWLHRSPVNAEPFVFALHVPCCLPLCLANSHSSFKSQIKFHGSLPWPSGLCYFMSL